jgi:hypothetical protein
MFWSPALMNKKLFAKDAEENERGAELCELDAELDEVVTAKNYILSFFILSKIIFYLFSFY